MREHRRALRYPLSVLIEKRRIGQRESGNLGAPGFERNECRKRRREPGDGMPERFGQSVAAAVGTGFGIRGASGGKHDGVETFGPVAGRETRNHVESGTGFNDGKDFRTESEVSFGNDALKYRHHVGSLVGNRKSPEVVLDLDGAPVGFEPFASFFRGEGSKGLFHEIRAAGIFGKQLLFGRNPGRDVATPPARNRHLLAHLRVPVVNGDVRDGNAFFHKGRRDHHSGGSSSDYCDFHVGTV